MHISQGKPVLLQPKNFRAMLAVVKIAGQQFTVKVGDKLFVPHLEAKTGETVEVGDVLLSDNGALSTAGGKVSAQILSDTVKGDKVIAFKMKRRKGFRKKRGHRTQYTQIQVTAIG